MTTILIDGKNACYRFGWVHKALITSGGTWTGAIYGVLDLLVRFKRDYPDAHFLVAWDGPGKTWRHKVFPGYKDREPAADPDIINVLNQIPTLKNILRMLAIPQVDIPEVEADDVIAVVAKECLKRDCSAIVFSSDRDFVQMMPWGAKLIRHYQDGPVDEYWVQREFRCKSRDVLKVRALSGDDSDKIPNVLPRVGVVTAAKMIASGCDPSGEKLCSSNESYRAKLAPVWDVARRNYQLMKLPDSMNDLRLGEKPQFKMAVLSSLRLLFNGPDRARTDVQYRQFISMLADLELKEAISNRLVLWGLSS